MERISIDSRTLSNPSDTAFIALKGERHDGHSYIPALILSGVKAFLVNQDYTPPQTKEKLNWILVPDTLEALQTLATWNRKESGAEIIGITGSNGKTIVKEWIYQSLRDNIPVFRSPRSYNSQVGVPLSALMIPENCKFAVLEAGISKPGEMSRLEKIIQPDIVIFTNLGEAHQENFKGMGEKLSEKSRLCSNAKTLICCRDQEMVYRFLKAEFPDKKLISWGQAADADYVIDKIRHTKSGINFRVNRKDKYDFLVPFHDHASLENALHVLTLLFNLGYDYDFIQNALKDFEPVEMRLEILKGVHSSTVISDTYNSDLASLSNAVDLLLQQNQHTRRTLILSDILQSGRSELDLYAEVASLIRDKKINRFIGIGPALVKTRDIFPPDSGFYPDTESFLKVLNGYNFRNEAILVKGARKFGFERISRELQFRTHQTVLEINLNAMVHNLNYYRSRLFRSTKIMAMVKAFSYGSGSVEIANILQYHKVDYLAVAYIDEGIDLRSNGITLPVVVMNPESGNFKALVEYGLQPEIYSFEVLKEFNDYLEKNDIRDYPVHIKLDTGMHRLGFLETEIGELADFLLKSRFIVVSVFSHLAGSDEKKHDRFTLAQIKLFNSMAAELRGLIRTEFLMHILNSSGIERFHGEQMDMVRLGIGLYGVSPNYMENLQEVSTFKTTISQIKRLKKGSTVGYSRKGVLKNDSTIAIIPVGYADGLPRSLGNGKGRFLLRGIPIRTVGNICMDMCMVDISGLDAKTGDEVIIFGPEHSVNLLARDAGTIPYEILTGISERVKRIYYQE